MYFRKVGAKSQTELLLDHFKVRNNISALEAASLLRIRSLSRRVNDLERMGHRFRRETREDSTGQRYVRYFYLGKERTDGEVGMQRFAS